MLGPEPAWPPPGRAGARTCTKKGKGLGFLLGLRWCWTQEITWILLRRAPPASPQLLLLLGVFPAPFGSVSCSFWGQLEGNPSISHPHLPHPTIPTRPRARHSTSPDTEAPRLKCYKTQCQSPSEHCPSLQLLLSSPSQSSLVLLVQLCSFSQRGSSDPAWLCSVPLRKALDIWVVLPF